ncbi:MAG: TetR/AcrR family transcriptional regulator [Thermoanaerobaculia bacterium]|nr:TetR/AcrR family transcriptional regulator [Thermoanaerobaculia bacterium]
MASFQKPPTVSDDYRAVDIYRKAAAIIYEKGFNATSMGDIAEAVDLTKGGLYYYIKGKKALLFAIMNFAIDQLEREILADVREEPDPERRLARLVAGHVRVVIQDPSAMSILVNEEENLTAEHAAKIVERKEEYDSLLRESIRDVLETNGNPGGLDPEVVTYSLLGMIHWVVRWYSSSKLDQDQVVHQISHLVLHGILSPFPA